MPVVKTTVQISIESQTTIHYHPLEGEEKPHITIPQTTDTEGTIYSSTRDHLNITEIHHSHPNNADTCKAFLSATQAQQLQIIERIQECSNCLAGIALIRGTGSAFNPIEKASSDDSRLLSVLEKYFLKNGKTL